MHVHLDLTGIIIITAVDIELWAVENRDQVIVAVGLACYIP